MIDWAQVYWYCELLTVQKCTYIVIEWCAQVSRYCEWLSMHKCTDIVNDWLCTSVHILWMIDCAQVYRYCEWLTVHKCTDTVNDWLCTCIQILWVCTSVEILWMIECAQVYRCRRFHGDVICRVTWASGTTGWQKMFVWWACILAWIHALFTLILLTHKIMIMFCICVGVPLALCGRFVLVCYHPKKWKMKKTLVECVQL